MPDPLAEAERLLEQGRASRDFAAAHTAASQLDHQPPRGDADNPRSSGLELLLLIAGLGGPPSGIPAPDGLEAGHAVLPLDAAGRAWPAVALHPMDPPAALELLDASVWAVRGAPLPLLAEWLRSPARRLLTDLDTLPALRGAGLPDWNAGATDLSAARLRRAVGEAGSSRWHELYDLVPGEALRTWTPAEHPALLPWALDRLERPEPFGIRGAVFGWLLDQRDRTYTIDGLKRDLREDAVARLALGRSPDHPDRHAIVQSESLDRLLLLHAAAIAGASPEVWDVPSTWRLARWLGAVLAQSPFLADRAVLVARLRALLPEEAPRAGTDALDPVRVYGMDLGDLFLLAGAARHVANAGRNAAPLSSPLRDVLRTLASRAENAPELEAERALAAGCDTLRWASLAPHVAPPVLARWLLSVHFRAPWLDATPEPVQVECLRALHAAPERLGWLALAWMNEPAAVRPIDLTRTATTDASLPHWVAGALGVSIAAHLNGPSIAATIDRASKGGDWAAPLLGRLAVGVKDHWSEAVDALLDLATTGAAGTRLNALLQAATALAAHRTTSPELARPRIDRARDLATAEPFRSHVGLVRELRRLSL